MEVALRQTTWFSQTWLSSIRHTKRTRDTLPSRNVRGRGSEQDCLCSIDRRSVGRVGWFSANEINERTPCDRDRRSARGRCRACPDDARVGSAGRKDAWSFSLSAYTYVLPDSHYVQPNVSADRGWLHLEARWNYEDLHTGSVWFGDGFSGGKTLEWELTPMIGGVFGDTSGIAPGFKGSLRWRKLELSSENEYVADAGNRSDSFFYNWSELTLAPVERFWFGLVTQRTRVYESDRDIERGVVAGVSFERVDLTGYVFDPDESRPWFVFAVEVTF